MDEDMKLVGERWLAQKDMYFIYTSKIINNALNLKITEYNWIDSAIFASVGKEKRTL
jgi:hypothetical protein